MVPLTRIEIKTRVEHLLSLIADEDRDHARMDLDAIIGTLEYYDLYIKRIMK